MPRILSNSPGAISARRYRWRKKYGLKPELSQDPGAVRSRRHRYHRRTGVRCLNLRVSRGALQVLKDGRFLQQDQFTAADLERAIWNLLSAARNVGLDVRQA
jgi:hypothetical protein